MTAAGPGASGSGSACPRGPRGLSGAQDRRGGRDSQTSPAPTLPPPPPPQPTRLLARFSADSACWIRPRGGAGHRGVEWRRGREGRGEGLGAGPEPDAGRGEGRGRGVGVGLQHVGGRWLAASVSRSGLLRSAHSRLPGPQTPPPASCTDQAGGSRASYCRPPGLPMITLCLSALRGLHRYSSWVNLDRGQGGVVCRRLPWGLVQPYYTHQGCLWDCSFPPPACLMDSVGTPGAATWSHLSLPASPRRPSFPLCLGIASAAVCENCWVHRPNPK